jgi:hypothetical protein
MNADMGPKETDKEETVSMGTLLSLLNLLKKHGMHPRTDPNSIVDIDGPCSHHSMPPLQYTTTIIPVPTQVPMPMPLFSAPNNLQVHQALQAPTLPFSSPRFDTPVNNFIPGITVSNEEDEKMCENPFTWLDKDIKKMDPIVHEPIIRA